MVLTAGVIHFLVLPLNVVWAWRAATTGRAVKNFTRLLDLERTQRDGKPDLPPVSPRRTTRTSRDIHSATHVFPTPSIDVDPLVLERERILPPGAGGAHGSAYKLLRTQTLKRLEQLEANIARRHQPLAPPTARR